MLVNLTTCETLDRSLIRKPVPIIITSYHRPITFGRCLDSVINNTNNPIYIVDNSNGKLNAQLQWASTFDNVIVWRNPKNIGKPASIKRHWHKIPKSQWFITMDPDVIVPDNGIQQLVNDANNLITCGYPIGIMAPAISECNIDWSTQLSNHELIMHEWNKLRQLVPLIYYNQNLAGCLMLVNSLLYNHIGGMPGTRLYNDDDGWLCNQSLKSGLLNVINSRVICEHDLSEETPGYRSWKDRNAYHQTDLEGHWD